MAGNERHARPENRKTSQELVEEIGRAHHRFITLVEESFRRSQQARLLPAGLERDAMEAQIESIQTEIARLDAECERLVALHLEVWERENNQNSV